MVSLPDPELRSGKLVVCAGVAVIDNIYRVAAFPEPGTKTRAQDFLQTGGGCAANAAIAVTRLGGRARLAAPLGGPAGAELTGDSILVRLNQEGIDVSPCVRVDGIPSPLSSVFVGPGGERLIVNYRHPALDAARPDHPAAILAGADALMIDNRLPDFVLPIARAARARGMTVVLDSEQPTERTEALFEVSTHIVFSTDGVRAATGVENLVAALRAAAKRTDAFVAVTHGAHDVLWLEAGTLRRQPAFEITAVDTLAAGDIFHGAFALSLAEGTSPGEALRFASATAALKCTRFGGGASCPTRGEVDRLLADHAAR